MDLTQIKELLRIVASSDVAELEIEEKGVKIVVRKAAPTVMVQQPYFPMPGYGFGGGYPPPQPMGAFPPPASTTPPEPPAGPVERPPVEKESMAKGVPIKAPIVGTFYRSPGPDTKPFVEVGDRVQVGDVLCIIEAMKLMNEIECETGGVITRILVQNGEPVEFDQPLFMIEPA